MTIETWAMAVIYHKPDVAGTRFPDAYLGRGTIIRILARSKGNNGTGRNAANSDEELALALPPKD